MFFSAGRPLAVGEKNKPDIFKDGGGQEPPKKTFLAFFGLSTPPADFIIRYVASLSPAYDGAGHGRQSLYWALFVAGTVWGLGPSKCDFRTCTAANSDFS